MKFFAAVLLITLLSVYGCKSQDNMVFGSQDVVKENEEVDYETIKIKAVLGVSKWQQIINTKSITIYRIDSILVDTSKNEYGRKLSEIKAINSKSVTDFLDTIKKDKNYPVIEKDTSGFNPSFLFEFCNENCELSALFDNKNNKVSFINLDGQQVFVISKEQSNYLQSMVIKKKN